MCKRVVKSESCESIETYFCRFFLLESLIDPINLSDFHFLFYMFKLQFAWKISCKHHVNHLNHVNIM